MPNTNQFTLKGFIKHQAKHTNESIASGAIQVKMSGTYTKDESVVVTIDSTTTKTETRPISHYHNKEVVFGGNSNWKPFSLTSTLPSDAYDITLKVEIIVNGVSCEVGVDDLQLCSGKQKTRYNLIENGYMEFEENGLPKGWQFQFCKTEDKLETVLSEDEHSSALGNKVMKFSAGNVDILLTNFKTRKMYKEIPCRGLSGEQLIFSVFAKALASSGNIFRSYIQFFYTNGEEKYYRFDFDKNFKNWQMLTRAVTAEYDFEKVEVGVEYNGGNEALFDCFQLYKDSFGKYYNYDERGNITEVVSEDGNSMRIDYDEDNQIKAVVANDGSCFQYDYDSQGRLQQITDLNGNRIVIQYDTSNYVQKTTIITASGETIVNQQERDQYGNITKAIDEHGNITLTTLNNLKQITQIKYPNGFMENMNYNKDLSLHYLQALIDTKTYQNSFTYDEAKQMQIVESENDTKYTFVHDDFGRLTKISVNGEVITQFTYNELTNGINKGLVSRKQYGLSGDYFDFIYNEDDQVTSVKLNGAGIVEYAYNEDGQVSEIKDIRNNISKYFSYNLKGKLIKVVDSQNKTISYSYDNLDNMQKTSYQMGEVEKSFDYEYDYEMNEYTKEGYFNRLEKVFGDEVVKGGMKGKGTYGATATKMNIEEIFDDSLNMKVYHFTSTNQCIQYVYKTLNKNRTGEYSNGLPFHLDNWRKRLFYNKTSYMWIKPKGNNAQEILLQFLKFHIPTDSSDTKEYDEMSELIVTKDGKIAYRSLIENEIIKETTTSLKMNQWNLVGIKLFKKTGVDSCQGMIFLNGEITEEFAIAENVIYISSIAVAKQKVLQPIYPTFTPSTTLSMPFRICMMSFGAYDYTPEDIKTIYYEGLKYLVNSTEIKKATGVSYYNADVYKNFDVITLNGSLESTRGNKPVTLMKTDSSFKVEKARIFKYDNSIQRHIYGAFDDVNNFTHGNKSLLAYNFNLKKKGIVSFRFKPEAPIQTNNRYILASYKNEQIQMAVFIDEENKLRFAFPSKKLICFQPMTMKTWYTITIFYINKKVTIYLDGLFFYSEELSEDIDLTDCTTYIGSLKNATSHLNGYVEMFAYSDKEETTSNSQTILAKSIYENGNTISIRKHLDSIGRVASKVIKTNKTEYETTYTLDKLRVCEETDGNNDKIEYTYDSMGNIVSKILTPNQETSQTTTYTYDLLGRLIKEVKPNGDIETFTYDENSNILFHQVKNKNGVYTANEKYNYSTTIKDQLVSIDSAVSKSTIREYKYEDSYKGNPTTIIKDGVSQTLIWEGRKLKQIGTQVRFDYNEEGIRIRKQGTTFVEDYLLDGSKIIKLHRDSTTGSYDMYFNYDEQGEIVGLSCEGKEYFYVRDITGNITKIIDEEGNPVVSYTYDAWGNFDKIIHTQCLVAYSNPFVYKGYFFDSETNWFYLKSRYYDPSIRRFINADDFKYLDNKSLNGINLYSYCGNNPILGYDPEGTWNWKTFGKIVCTIVIVTACIVVSSLIAGPIGVAKTAISILTSAVDGGISAVASGGDFWDGFMAGAIGGSIGGVFGSWGHDIIGRGFNSFIYDCVNEWFQTGTINFENIGLYAFDAIMDMAYSALYVRSMPNSLLGNLANGVIDGIIDVTQTILIFSPKAQKSIRDSADSNISLEYSY